MKTTILFLFCAMFVCTGFAQTCVSVKQVSADYNATVPTVTFDVHWDNNCGTTEHNLQVWVWIDYRALPGTNWERATVAGTITSTPNASPSTVSGNTRGFWLTGEKNMTSRVTVPVNVGGSRNFNWCAFASDYPPNVGTVNAGTYTLRGTPPFTLFAADGTTTQVVNGKTLPASSLTITPTTLTDATGCPGHFCIIEYSDCAVLYACRELPNDRYSSMAIAHATCEATFGAGWRMPTLAELSCGWGRLYPQPFLTRYFYYVTEEVRPGEYGGCDRITNAGHCCAGGDCRGGIGACWPQGCGGYLCVHDR